MEARKNAKNAIKFYCEKCNFTCSKKSNYDQHLLTAKHNRETSGIKKTAVYICEFCDREYKSRGSHWKHQQKCDKVPYIQEQYQEPPIKVTDSTMIIELLKQNQEFKEMMIEQSRQIQ